MFVQKAISCFLSTCLSCLITHIDWHWRQFNIWEVANYCECHHLSRQPALIIAISYKVDWLRCIHCLNPTLYARCSRYDVTSWWKVNINHLCYHFSSKESRKPSIIGFLPFGKDNFLCRFLLNIFPLSFSLCCTASSYFWRFSWFFSFLLQFLYQVKRAKLHTSYTVSSQR